MPTPTPLSTADSGTNVIVSISSDEPSVISNDSEVYAGWDSDNAASEPANAPMLPESEGSRVGHIVKLLISGSQKLSSEENGSDESEHLGGEGLFSGLTRLRIRRRYDIEGLMARMDQERRTELDTLKERQAVSRFSHRGRIQVSV